MNEATLKALLQKNSNDLEITVKYDEGQRYNIIIDGEPLASQRGKARIFRLPAAAEFLRGLGVTRFIVEN
ncbi:TPA: hypothetical protein NJ400_004484 [Vibrio parahaemolyticus]|nr:hypothetical protein [Vibrio parahaemolyticus]EGQ8464371.1 hypothetical protein [Vibrio parahaemolyticus]EGQ9405958.1 hypothetical protein [Vibrio parahaemolyticus]EGR0297569.1 hypothetical protein [Vibrio parahaemolyticus]EHM6955211.1 hypothetical protein [Vibrio parahaemolyticus]